MPCGESRHVKQGHESGVWQFEKAAIKGSGGVDFINALSAERHWMRIRKGRCSQRMMSKKNCKIYSDANKIRKAGLEFEEDNEIDYEHVSLRYFQNNTQ